MPKWSEKDLKYLKENWGVVPPMDMEDILNRKSATISAKALRMGLTPYKKQWTAKELNYLKDNWGVTPLSKMEKKLKKSLKAIRAKASKEGLGIYLQASSTVSISDLSAIIGKTVTAIHEWIAVKNFPVEKIIIKTKECYVIEPEKFWEWAEENQNVVDLSKIEDGILGPEPDWAKKKRMFDYQKKNIVPRKGCSWTKEEDERLVNLIESMKYTYKDISKIMGRSDYSISNRIVHLGLKLRPAKAPKISKWPKEDEETLIDLIKNQCPLEVIATKFSSYSMAAINKKIKSMKKKGLLDFEVVNNQKKLGAQDLIRIFNKK